MFESKETIVRATLEEARAMKGEIDCARLDAMTAASRAQCAAAGFATPAASGAGCAASPCGSGTSSR
jgi:hypothetical protein